MSLLSPKSLLMLFWAHNLLGLGRLLVNGAKSKELPNLRGLLQGSTLSPILFNFFINELVMELEMGEGGMMVWGKVVKALFFADDGALMAYDEERMARMLGTCERWSVRAGMEFAPTKCLLFAPPPEQRTCPLQLYGIDLPSTLASPYLGFPFTPRGINWKALAMERCAKARKVVAGMRNLGMNVTGWAPAAAAQVYITFVRPVMEYGIELRSPSPALLRTYQRTQNFALRTILSASPNTSIQAMHRVLAIPMFKIRAQELNFLSASRFHNSTDAW